MELLDKTVDGSQFKLSMKIPGDLAGRLLGINGEQIQVISRSHPPSKPGNALLEWLLWSLETKEV